MRVPVKLVPNVLSGVRLLLLPVLWILALQGRPAALGIGLILAGTTDVLDGFLARKLDAVSDAGAALDSLADNLLILSVAAWLLMIRPDVVARFGLWFVLVVTLHVAFLVIGMVRFRRFGNLHLYSAKVAAVAGFTFAVACFLTPGIPLVLGVLALSLATAAVVEGLACQILFQRVDESFGSVFRAVREQSDRRRREDREHRDDPSPRHPSPRLGHGGGITPPEKPRSAGVNASARASSRPRPGFVTPP